MTPPRNRAIAASSVPSVEPTIWALRKNTRQSGQDNDAPSLYEHLYGYDPIKVLLDQKRVEFNPSEKPKTSPDTSGLSVINPQTNFAIMEIAADLPPERD